MVPDKVKVRELATSNRKERVTLFTLAVENVPPKFKSPAEAMISNLRSKRVAPEVFPTEKF